MKKLIFFAIITAFFTSCNDKKLNLPAENENTAGLNSLTTLNVGINKIFLQDFILDCGKIDSVTCSDTNLKIGYREDISRIDILAEEGFGNFADLQIWVENVPISVPLRKSDKIDYVFKFNPNGKTYKRVQIAGQMNNWVASLSPDLQQNSEGIYEVTLNVAPATYLYQLVLDGEQNHDATNPNKVDNGMGKFNSVLQIEGNETKFPHLITKNISEKYFTLNIMCHSALDAESLNNQTIAGQTRNDNEADTKIFAYWENYLLPQNFISIKNNEIKISIPQEAKEKEFSTIRVWAANSYGVSNDILIPLKNGKIVQNAAELSKTDNFAKIIYFALVDRFLNGNKDNDFPMNRPNANKNIYSVDERVDYQGGDLAGISLKIDDGYFNKLGVNTLWLSPLNQNPMEPYGYTAIGKTKFSGYHGYWPISSSKVDFRFGTNDELKNLVKDAHNHDISVILDYVANHVHQNHPLYKQHPEFATSMYLPDGRRNLELWDEQRLTTWFDTFIPKLDFSNPQVVDMMSDSALFWVKEFGIDGFRQDACKHINEEFWRELTLKIKRAKNQEPRQEREFYQIGESYGSPELVASYVNSGMLNGQFDFNVYDEATSAFNGVSGGTLNRILNILKTSFKMYGVHNQMGNISGNHDKPRFMALASGDLKVGEDAKIAAWTKKIGVTDSTAYDKLALFHIFNLTITGVPVIYYGDEIGLTGANDPDSRRMMHFDFNPREQKLFDIIAKTAHLRTTNMALLYGDFINIFVDETSWVYARKYFDNEAIIVINNSDKEKTFEVELPKNIQNRVFSMLFISPNPKLQNSRLQQTKSKFKIQNNILKITLQPYEAEVFY